VDWAERFEARIERTESCWNWTGFIDREGYGHHRRTHDGQRAAHRLAYELWTGPIPAGLTIDHLCRNRRCVNPAHLEAVTIGENIRRSREATKTYCVNGHEFDAPNTHVRANGHRECRPCMRDRARAYRRRRRLVNT
jgi:hypothetical protein